MTVNLNKKMHPDMKGSFAAMKRAARMARKVALATGTAIVVERDGKTVRIHAEQLRDQKAK